MAGSGQILSVPLRTCVFSKKIMSIASIQHQGVLIDECAQDGERRSDDTVPAHPNGIPVSATRWLLVYATRRFRGNDDDCSIVYQLRADQPDGKLIREGMLARTTEDWVPDGFRPGKSYKKEHRHPAAFGVPKGAVINEKKASNSNVFVIQWGTVARGLGWIRLEDPFAPLSDQCSALEPIRPPLPATRAPATFFVCADGVLRCFAGEGPSSPYGREWDPLYCWDIDPDEDFRASNRRVVYDTVQAGLPIRPEAGTMVDMCKLFFHQGATQYLVHRVIFTTMRREHVHTRPEFWIFPPMNQAELESCGIYYATITYDEVAPLPWSFPPASEKTP